MDKQMDVLPKKEKSKYDWAIRPDAQGFDEIRIKVVPRFKQSDLSGDEWRISTLVEFMRNGMVLNSETHGSKMEYAAGMVYADLMRAQDNGNGYFAGDGIHCDQEGCHEPGKFVMKILKEYCCGGGNCGQEKKSYSQRYRLFCDKHKRRGDSDLEDNDKNYELVEVI